MGVINTSLFELLKIGPGPSSSHTIGPMKAGFDFYQMTQGLPTADIEKATRLEVILYGSLAATGKGHGTDRAVIAGLLGQSPESCAPDFLDSIDLCKKKPVQMPVGDRWLTFRVDDLLYEPTRFDFPFSNTMVIRLYAEKSVLLEREYYSVGGGFLQWKGWEASPRGKPKYPYANAEELLKLVKKHRISLDALMMANEESITGTTTAEIEAKLDHVIAVMEDAVQRGLQTEGFLPGPIGLHRKGALMYQRAKALPQSSERLLVYLCAYGFAAAEENASGHIVVTAPTCGAAGVLPAIITLMRKHQKLSQAEIRKGLLASVAVGFIAKENASISGADVGCQGEVGVASSMAAALIAYANGAEVLVAENAAETALEQHLGMTCDPVKGYVQIPCVERNAMGAVKAYSSWLIAREGLPVWHLVGLDSAVEAMNQTGRDMKMEYRETSLGGLARCHC